MAEPRVAVVTGSNKGIGLEIVKQLASQGITTVLTARDEKKGSEAVESLLKAHNLHVNIHQLDVSDQASVTRFAAWIGDKFGRIDVLVNNAGVTDKQVGEAKAVLETNYYGAKRVTEALLPLLKPGGRIINVSSRLGQFDNKAAPLKNEQQKRRLSDEEKLTEEVIETCLKEFTGAAARGALEEEGYPSMIPAYCMSKLALNAYTRVLARELSASRISVNAICPGYTKTDINAGAGERSVEEGADTAVWLATLDAQDNPTGTFFGERNRIPF